MLDRRHGSVPAGDAVVGRRADDRRRLAVDHALHTRGLAIILGGSR